MSRDLEQFAADLDPAALDRRLRRTFTTLASRSTRIAKRNATIRPRVRTGRLRSSIRTQTKKAGGKYFIQIQAGNSVVNYAGVQEHGAVIRRGAGRPIVIPATRFLGRAIEEISRQAPALLRNDMRAHIRGGR